VKVGKHSRPEVGFRKPWWWRLEPFQHRESGCCALRFSHRNGTIQGVDCGWGELFEQLV